jgi:hypothetical protein
MDISKLGVNDPGIIEFMESLESGYLRKQNRGKRKVTEIDRLNMILFDAVCFTDFPRIKRAAELGADINHIDVDMGITAMHMAVSRQCPEMCELLLSLGGKPTILDKEGNTSLDDAWRQARADINARFAESLERSWREATRLRHVRELSKA